MPLEAPNLDNRTFDDLVKEAKERIPRYTQEWTNFNDADPGMTIVKLHAWLTETLLHELNRVPELHYIKFLNLLNIQAAPAQAANTDLQFSLKKLDKVEQDPLIVFIPKAAQVEADDPDLEEPVIFETDRTLRAINAAIGAIIVPEQSADATRTKALISNYDEKTKLAELDAAFYPFSENPKMGAECLIGILLRPHRKKDQDYSQQIFPEGELEIAVSATEVYEKDENKQVLQGPTSTTCLLPFAQEETSKTLQWQIYVGSDHANEFPANELDSDAWQTLYPPVDGSEGLSKSGYISLPIPANVSQLSLVALNRDYWLSLGYKKLPYTASEFLDDINDTELNFTPDNIADLELYDMLSTEVDKASYDAVKDNIADLLALLTTHQDLLVVDDALRELLQDGEFAYSTPNAPLEEMAWLRIKVLDVNYTPSLLNGFYLNRVPATAAVTHIEEVLGVSNAKPGQQFPVSKTPIYVNLQGSGNLVPDFDLEVVQAGSVEKWQLVDDFGRTEIDSFSQVYRLDPISGQVRFGDGVKGQIPVANAQIKVTRYRSGGGSQGNVAPNTVTKLKTSILHVDSVANPRAVTNGKDAETLDEAKRRAPQAFASRDRAVTADDFEYFTKQTPGVNIHSAYALSQTAVNDDHSFREQNGAITMVVLPANEKQSKPEPTESQLKAICAYLNSKRLITTELYVTGPRYTDVALFEVQIKVEQSADLKTVSDAVSQKLSDYFHPLHGGLDSQGWPFGEDIYFSDIYALIQSVVGVKRVFKLKVKLAGLGGEACSDMIPVQDGHLLYLPRNAMNIQVAYD